MHTPWSDVADLIVPSLAQNANGYPITPVEPDPETPGQDPPAPPAILPDGAVEQSRRTVFCNFEDGVSQSEFYLSRKEGHRASAQIEIWTIDYEGETFVAFPGGSAQDARFYRVIRSFKEHFDTTTLILEEVIRS